MEYLRSCFPIKDLGEAGFYLGCHITRDRDAGTLKLDQHRYVRTVADTTTQVTATSADTALSQGKHRGPYPTMLQRIPGLLRKPQELMKQQMEDSHLLGEIQDLHNGGTGGEYVADDDWLL